VKDENKLLQQKLRATLQPQKEPTISMSELVEAEHKAATAAGDHDDVFGQPLDDDVQPDHTSKFVASNFL